MATIEKLHRELIVELATREIGRVGFDYVDLLNISYFNALKRRKEKKYYEIKHKMEKERLLDMAFIHHVFYTALNESRHNVNSFFDKKFKYLKKDFLGINIRSNRFNGTAKIGDIIYVCDFGRRRSFVGIVTNIEEDKVYYVAYDWYKKCPVRDIYTYDSNCVARYMNLPYSEEKHDYTNDDKFVTNVARYKLRLKKTYIREKPLYNSKILGCINQHEEIVLLDTKRINCMLWGKIDRGYVILKGDNDRDYFTLSYREPRKAKIIVNTYAVTLREKEKKYLCKENEICTIYEDRKGFTRTNKGWIETRFLKPLE